MIRVDSFTFNPFQENTYVVSNDADECMIVDPGMYTRAECQTLRQHIESRGLQPVLLVNTHCHIDHVFGNAFVGDTYGLTPVIHQLERPVLDAVPTVAQMYQLNYDPSPEPEYFDGDELMLGSEKFEILFAPGHAPGHVAFHHADSKTLLSGDVLFRESIGRTDLPGGDMDTLLHSIRTQLFTLDDDTKVYAGHMGPTTIGHEKKYNPFLAGTHQGEL